MLTRMSRVTCTFLFGLGLGLVSGCKHPAMATPDQCQALVDHFIDLKLAQDPAAATMTPADRVTRRAKITQDVQTDSDVLQVKTSCTTQVTAEEYTCAIAAKSADRWNDCID